MTGIGEGYVEYDKFKDHSICMGAAIPSMVIWALTDSMDPASFVAMQ